MSRRRPVALCVLTLTATASMAALGLQSQPQIDQIVDRIMRNDADGSGTITKDELPEGLGERLFADADTNEDEVLDRAELEAYAVTRLDGRDPAGVNTDEGRPDGSPRPPRGDRAATPESFDDAMRQSGRALRLLRRTMFDDASRPADLRSCQMLQMTLLVSKGLLDEAPISLAAREAYGIDDAARLDAMRLPLLEALRHAVDLEKAVIEGRGDDARRHVARILELEDAAHEAFRPQRRRGGGPAGSGRAGSGAGAGAGAGAGGDGGATRGGGADDDPNRRGGSGGRGDGGGSGGRGPAA